MNICYSFFRHTVLRQRREQDKEIVDPTSQHGKSRRPLFNRSAHNANSMQWQLMLMTVVESAMFISCPSAADMDINLGLAWLVLAELLVTCYYPVLYCHDLANKSFRLHPAAPTPATTHSQPAHGPYTCYVVVLCGQDA